jgi:hypothetical protein
MRRPLGALLFVIYIIIGVVVAAEHHYFEDLDALKPIVSAVLGVLLWPSSSSGSTCISSRGQAGGDRSHTASRARPLLNPMDRVPTL